MQEQVGFIGCAISGRILVGDLTISLTFSEIKLETRILYWSSVRDKMVGSAVPYLGLQKVNYAGVINLTLMTETKGNKPSTS